MLFRSNAERRMLDYLDSLCAALLARNGTEIRRLLRHPLARALPRRVREEGYAIARAGPESLRAPCRRCTSTIRRSISSVLAPRRAARQARLGTTNRADDEPQIEIPLRAAGG
jgi:hypothetical protein